jgi:hypothetical protein
MFCQDYVQVLASFQKMLWGDLKNWVEFLDEHKGIDIFWVAIMSESTFGSWALVLSLFKKLKIIFIISKECESKFST